VRLHEKDGRGEVKMACWEEMTRNRRGRKPADRRLGAQASGVKMAQLAYWTRENIGHRFWHLLELVFLRLVPKFTFGNAFLIFEINWVAKLDKLYLLPNFGKSNNYIAKLFFNF